MTTEPMTGPDAPGGTALQSRRLATIPIDSYDLAPELRIIDEEPTTSTYDAFTFGSWNSYVLANHSGVEGDDAFRPHDEPLRPTALGARLPEIMRLVRTHFDTSALQWLRIFGLRDGLLAPHRDFLEFEKPGVRIQVPLRTGPRSLHSENSLVYHLRRGEVWQIHTVDPHSAFSADDDARLSLCLDFAAGRFDPADDIRGAIAAAEPECIVERKPLGEFDLSGLIASADMRPESIRETFRRFATVHFDHTAAATDAFDWFVRAAVATGDERVIAKARAFRVYCIESRAYGEHFDWT